VSEVDGISSVYNQCLKKKVEINEILMHVLSSPMRVLYILQNKKEQDSIYANVKYSNIEMLTSQLSKWIADSISLLRIKDKKWFQSQIEIFKNIIAR